MADNTIANAIKFLKGEEKSLPATKTEGQVYFAYKNVGTAEKPSYTGAIYIDTPIGGTQNRVKMTANADIADKAFNDSAGLNIRETYLSSLGYTDDGKQTILIKGSGNNQTRIALPIASLTKSGIVTTDAQSFGGTKTFVTINSTNLTITGPDGFNYSSIGSGTADAVRPVWFADNSGNGKPVVNTNFTYNPATQTLSVANLSGTADKANKDSAGNDIKNTYISNITLNDSIMTITKGSGATSTLSIKDKLYSSAVMATKEALDKFIEANVFKFGHINAIEGYNGLEKNDGIILSGSWNSSTNYGHQIYIDDSGYALRHRYRNSGNWSDWASILDSTNYNSYAPTKTGGGASGTWGISISGNAASANKLNTDAGSATRPVYFSGGFPITCNYLLANSISGNAATATNATNDSGGQNIRNTYISNIEVDKDNKYKYNFKTPTGAIKNSITVYDEFQKRSIVTATTDWNTLTSTGIYKVQMSVWGDATKMHSPNSYSKDLYNYGILLVFDSVANDGEKRFTQIYIPHDANIDVSGSAYKRMHNGSDINTGWLNWHPIARGLHWNELTGKPNYAGSGSAGGAADYALKLQTYKQNSTTETYGTQFSLYAQWQTNTVLKLKSDGHSTLVDRATLLNPIYTSSTLTTDTSTWRGAITDGKVVWGQKWKDTSLSNDTGDLTLYLNKVGNDATINMILDGTVTAVQGFNGNLIKTTPQLCASSENNEITIKVNDNNIFSNSTGIANASLRNGLDFRWYDTNWQIGNIRGSSVNSIGFGFAFKADKNSALALKARIDTNGVYHGGVDKLATARKITLAGLGRGSVLFDGSGDVTITDVGYGCTKYVTRNTTTEPYYRIAYYSNNNSWVDASIVFSIDSGFIGGGFGIIKVAFRSNNVSTDNPTSHCEVSWLVRNGFEANQIFVKGNAPTGGQQYADLYYKATGQYQSVTIRVLSSGERGSIARNWTFEEGASRKNADIRAYSYTTYASDEGIVKNSIKWNNYENDIGTNNTTDTWLLIANNGKIQHRLSTSFASASHTHSYLPLSGGTMSGTSFITWADSGNWNNKNKNVTFPVNRGGLQWDGQSDYIKLFSQETASDNLELVLQFGDDNSNGLSIRDYVGKQTARIASDGSITASSFIGNLNGNASTATNVAWSGVTGKPSTFTPSSHEHSYVLDVNNGSHTTFAYSKTGMNYGDYTWLAAWNGNELRAVNKSQFATASHTHPYLPLVGGTMTGTINFTVNKLACNFRSESGSSSYRSGVMHQSGGNEALVFAAARATTSFIFKCGQDPVGMTSSTWTGITPSMQIRNQSVYINYLVKSDAVASYNLYVNGTTRCNGTLGVGNGSNAEIDFFPNSASIIGARIKAYNDRIEFVFV